MNMYNKIGFSISVCAQWYLKAIALNNRKRFKKPIHILFCMVDHYEPGTGKVSQIVAKERVDLLLKQYPKLVDKHRDSSGFCPKRTWFFPPHYHTNYFLKDLVTLCARGYGEIELHLHHGKDSPDSSDNLEMTLRQSIKEYSYFGIFGTQNNFKRFAFIHGDWALNNSRNGRFCGVNNEIEILIKSGCFADFTFPSLNESNPSQINSIYYAKSQPACSKFYDHGSPVKVSHNIHDRGLMIIQGPLHPFFKDNSLFSLRVLGDSINGDPPVNQRRIDYWVKTEMCIKGQEDVIIIKTHTHGATDYKAVLGDEMEQIFSYLENNYNDGNKYILHYVTARELYNIIKSIEAGEFIINPNNYRDFLIKPPIYDMHQDIPEASQELMYLISKTYRG
jgi:hypothetical protein